MSNRGRHPDWVHKHTGLNQKVRRVDGQYHLFDIEGDREKYLGIITPEGVVLVECLGEHVSFSPWLVLEYGASKGLLDTCPPEWKASRGSGWREDLLFIIYEEHLDSYFLIGVTPVAKGNMHLARKQLNYLLKGKYDTSIEEICSKLSSIKILVNEETGEKLLSRPSEEAMAFSKKIDVNLEVIL